MQNVAVRAFHSMANTRHERFPNGTFSVKTTDVTDGFTLIHIRFFLGILSDIGYGFDSLGDRIHSLFTSESCLKHSGSRRCSCDPECPRKPQALQVRAAFGCNA